MKKLTFADGSVGYRDKGMWLELEGVPVVTAELSTKGLEAITAAPIEPVEQKKYDDAKPIRTSDASSHSDSSDLNPVGR